MNRTVALLALAACSRGGAARPAPQVLGVAVGHTSVADARAAVEAAGHPCVDASLGTILPGAPSGPGARLTCAGVPVDDGAPGVTARLLLVGDAGGTVVALALQRTQRDRDLAADDARAMFAGLEHHLGAPAEHAGEVPALGAQLAPVTPVRRLWRAGAVTVEARATDLGATGVELSETIALRNR